MASSFCSDETVRIVFVPPPGAMEAGGQEESETDRQAAIEQGARQRHPQCHEQGDLERGQQRQGTLCVAVAVAEMEGVGSQERPQTVRQSGDHQSGQHACPDRPRGVCERAGSSDGLPTPHCKGRQPDDQQPDEYLIEGMDGDVVRADEGRRYRQHEKARCPQQGEQRNRRQDGQNAP